MRNNKVKVFLVEDNAIIRASIKSVLTDFGFEVVGEEDEASRAFEKMQEADIDVAILDINLIGEKDGVWLAHQISTHLEFPFVFLTAFGDDATLKRVIETKPSGYLMKPFKGADIFSAIHIALENYANKKTAQQDIDEQPKEENMIFKGCLFIKDKNLLVRVKYDDIRFMRSEGNYIEIIDGSSKHLVRDKLTNLYNKLPKDKFLQVHLRYIINVDKVDSIGQGFVMIGEDEISVSKSYTKDLMSKIQF